MACPLVVKASLVAKIRLQLANCLIQGYRKGLRLALAIWAVIKAKLEVEIELVASTIELVPLFFIIVKVLLLAQCRYE